MINKEKIFIEYYNQFKDKIFNYFWYRVNFNRPIAEDLTSEVFIRAYANFESFDQDRPFQSWIYKIAHNHLINHYRVSNREVDLDYAENIPSDLKQILVSLDLEQVLEEIKKLEPYHRDALLLRFEDGLSNSEIAEILNKDESAVRTQISRALGMIREKLKDFDNFPVDDNFSPKE